MHIRPALAQDLERVWELFKQVIDEDIYYPYDQHTTREEIEHSWVTLKNLVWVATDETSGEITGA